MSVKAIDQALAALLRKVDTPTVCNAIEVAQGKRGFDRFTRSSVLPANANLPAFFGFARTARAQEKRSELAVSPRSLEGFERGKAAVCGKRLPGLV